MGCGESRKKLNHLGYIPTGVASFTLNDTFIKQVRLLWLTNLLLLTFTVNVNHQLIFTP